MKRLEAWLSTAHGPGFALFAMLAAFATYFCMYAFRKPFAAAHYDGYTLGTFELKTVLVISQIIGYTTSKYIGIKVCSEATRKYRATMIVGLIAFAELTLVVFAIVPPTFKPLALFFNGLPLGMIWGLVVGYLEGRKVSELLLAGLSCSYIISSGIVKDVGRALMSQWQVSEWFMPAATGLCFFPFLVLSVWLMDHLPQPTPEDVAARVRREPMFSRHRMSFMREFAFGLTLLLVVYFFQTAYRDYRDNYGVEIFAGLGYEEQPAIFTRTEIPVAFGVMGAFALLNLIRNNRRGLIGAYIIMIGGAVIVGLSTLLLHLGMISGVWWMILIGLGSYLTYVPFGSVLFDRMMAATGFVGTAVFSIYLSDAIGYTGSIFVQLYKDLSHSEISQLQFFRGLSYFVSALGVVLMTVSCISVTRKARFVAVVETEPEVGHTPSSSPAMVGTEN